MEDELRSHLLRLAEGYAAARSIKLPTVARSAAGDWRFFDRLQSGDTTFTARKYDEVVRWFFANWPEGVEWPDGIAQPELVSALAGVSA